MDGVRADFVLLVRKGFCQLGLELEQLGTRDESRPVHWRLPGVGIGRSPGSAHSPLSTLGMPIRRRNRAGQWQPKTEHSPESRMAVDLPERDVIGPGTPMADFPRNPAVPPSMRGITRAAQERAITPAAGVILWIRDVGLDTCTGPAA